VGKSEEGMDRDIDQLRAWIVRKRLQGKIAQTRQACNNKHKESVYALSNKQATENHSQDKQTSANIPPILP